MRLLLRLPHPYYSLPPLDIGNQDISSSLYGKMCCIHWYIRVCRYCWIAIIIYVVKSNESCILSIIKSILVQCNVHYYALASVHKTRTNFFSPIGYLITKIGNQSYCKSYSYDSFYFFVHLAYHQKKNIVIAFLYLLFNLVILKCTIHTSTIYRTLPAIKVSVSHYYLPIYELSKSTIEAFMEARFYSKRFGTRGWEFNMCYIKEC